jgi:hypothetical protein
MRPSRARPSGPAPSCHMLSSVDCITTTSESEFWYTQESHALRFPVRCRPLASERFRHLCLLLAIARE